MKKEEKKSLILNEENIGKDEQVYPNGSFFGVLNLPIDSRHSPSAYRMVQYVNRGGKLEAYATENAFIRAELTQKKDAAWRTAFDEGPVKGLAGLRPTKTRIHWCRVTESFCMTGKGPRINPETGEAELSE